MHDHRRGATGPLRIVLTGAPGAGKTTTARLLSGLGFPVFGEAARLLIRAELARRSPRPVLPWTNLPEFVSRLWRVQRRQYRRARRYFCPVFYDRGIPDALAFLSFHRTVAPPGYLDACRRYRYSLVLDLAMPHRYRSDVERPYSATEAQQLAELNRSQYCRLGYSLVPVPVLAPRLRLHHVLNYIGRHSTASARYHG